MGARPREERFVKSPEMDGDVFSRQSGNLNDSATVMGHSQEMFCFCIKKITESEAAREVWCRVGLTRVSGGVGSRAIARGEPGERDQAALCLGLYHTPVI